ncbi:MAG: glutamate racemase [Clostridia bacterium]|nr:glutamate racemase [Clostridia bacterium]
MKIGIFDSGIGGLSVLPAARRALPTADILYYADEEHVPYGEKTPEEILAYSMEAVDILVSMGARAIVVACNTATSVAVSALRAKYEVPEKNVPIIGMEPAVKKALDTCAEGRILVAATPVTVRGQKLKLLVDRYDTNKQTDAIPMPGLVRLAEKGMFGTPEADEYIKNEIAHLDMSDYSALVLGCTHFNYFKDSFKRVLPDHVSIVDGVEGTVRRLVSRLPDGEDGSGSVEFFISGKRSESSEKFLKLIERLEKMEEIK